MVTSEQMRAARAMLRMEQKALAEASGVSLATVKRLEGLDGTLIANRPTLTALQAALESAGVIFVAENGDGPGVRLRKAAATAETLTDRIEALEAEVADMPGSDAPSPEAAMQTMDKALAESELAGLKQKRKRLRKATPK